MTLPRKLLKSVAQHRAQLEQIGQKFGVQQLDDWYNAPREKVLQMAPFISKKYLNLFSALKKFYPHHNWDSFKFFGTSDTLSTHKQQLDQLAKELNINHPNDWYNVSKSEVYERAPFIRRYYTNLSSALMTIYPQHEWDPQLFNLQSNSWRSIETQRNKLEQVGRELGVKELDDWYKVSRLEVYKRAPFVQRHYHNLYVALKKIYPNHNWNELQFSRYLSGFWQRNTKDIISSVLFQDFLANTSLHATSPHPKEHLLLKRFTPSIVSKRVPVSHTSHAEKNLQDMLRSFTRVESPSLIGEHSVDVFLPEYNLAIEYQGNQHYQQTHRGNFGDQMERDKRKSIELKQLGMKVVHIGYWWNGSWSHLLSSLQKSNSLQQLEQSNSVEESNSIRNTTK